MRSGMAVNSICGETGVSIIHVMMVIVYVQEARLKLRILSIVLHAPPN